MWVAMLSLCWLGLDGCRAGWPRCDCRQGHHRPGRSGRRRHDSGEGHGHGKISSVVAGKNGEFRLDQSPGGHLRDLRTANGRAHRALSRNQTSSIEAGKTLTFNIELMPNNFGIVGDDAAFLQIYDKYANQKGPAPRTRTAIPISPASGSPTWIRIRNRRRCCRGRVAEWDAATRPRVRRHADVEMPADGSDADAAGLLQDHPDADRCSCICSSRTRTIARRFSTAASHPKDLDPTWMGHTIGRWEKDTLVLDTVGLNDKSWLLQAIWLPHTEKLHIVERYHRPDLAHLNIDVTIEDPDTFIKPVERHVHVAVHAG